ncbi:SRPBCC family protein [Rhizobium terrae]|uniref:SRPBCC family protein n=1 Tax=Rhizobium terrae TaxID=2171756 RepID=UPI000E3D1883|nr:SRPBCC family protein [Rhizobium terrae]
MNDMTSLIKYGVVSEPFALTIQRRLPGPIERVWSYLADSDLRRQWLASGIIPAEPGKAFELTWRNDELSSSSEGKPEGFPAEHTMQSEVIAFEAPHRLVFSWPPRGEVSFELQQAGSEILLTVTHRRISDRKNMVMVGAGWHAHLDILVARLNERKPASFWQDWKRLKEEYDRLIPAE